MGWFKKMAKALDPMIGKTVIRFTTHGCMGQDEQFDFIGIISGVSKAEMVPVSGAKFYVIDVLKDKYGDGTGKIRHVPSWYLQKLNDSIFVAYD